MGGVRVGRGAAEREDEAEGVEDRGAAGGLLPPPRMSTAARTTAGPGVARHGIPDATDATFARVCAKRRAVKGVLGARSLQSTGSAEGACSHAYEECSIPCYRIWMSVTKTD